MSSEQQRLLLVALVRLLDTACGRGGAAVKHRVHVHSETYVFANGVERVSEHLILGSIVPVSSTRENDTSFDDAFHRFDRTEALSFKELYLEDRRNHLEMRVEFKSCQGLSRPAFGSEVEKPLAI